MQPAWKELSEPKINLLKTTKLVYSKIVIL